MNRRRCERSSELWQAALKRHLYVVFVPQRRMPNLDKTLLVTPKIFLLPYSFFGRPNAHPSL